jgi:hypothetical protein
MKLKEVNECMNQVKRDVGDALLSSIIANISGGSTIVKYNTEDKMGAVSAQVISFLADIVANDDQKLGRYMFIDINEHVTAVFVIIEDYVWNINIDPAKMPLGMLVNVYLDDLINAFESAL